MEIDEARKRVIPELTPSTNHSYFYMPPLWLGKQPTDDELSYPTNELIKVVASKHLSVGIKIDACRDGIFVFDFTAWPDGCPVTIPSHTIEGGKRPPEEVMKAREKNAEHRYNCMAVMNAHLACMSTAITKIEGNALPIKQIITPSSYFTTDYRNGHRSLVGINDDAEPILAYVSANYHLDKDILKKRRRTTIKLDAVEHAFDLLSKIFASNIPDMLLMTTLIYYSAINYSRHDFSTALTISWTVCEKLLRILWDGYIEDMSHLVDEKGTRIRVINKDRRKALTGANLTAYVMSEMLALAGRIKNDTYIKLSNARKNRNDWLHSLTRISGTMAAECIRTAELFLEEVSAVELKVNLSYSNRL